MEYTHLQTRPHPLELRTHVVLANGDFGSVAGLISRRMSFLPSGQGGSLAPRIRSCRSQAVKSYLLKHEVMTLKQVGNRRDFP